MVTFRGLLTFCFICLFCSGCSSLSNPKKHAFSFITSAQHANKTWPEGGAVAHYSFIGDIQGESNLTEIKAENESTLGKIWSFITGIADDNPIVLQRPQGILVNGNKIYISDVSHQAIFVFDTLHGSMDIWNSAQKYENFSSPIGLSLAPNNELLVADSERGQVIRLSAQGQPLGIIEHPSLKRPTGVLYSKLRDEIYVSDTSEHNIKVFDNFGVLQRIIGEKGSKALQFNAPTFLAEHPDGILVSDTLNARVQLLAIEDGNEELLKIFGRRGTKLGNLTRPKGVASDSQGNVYIIESYFDHLLVFNQQRQFLLPLGGTGYGVGEFYLPSGIWIDDKNRVFIADMMNGRITVFQFLTGHKAGASASIQPSSRH